MDNTLVVCGGTGAHTALAFLRLHTLGYALGFFDQSGKPMSFPTLFLVDQDANDGVSGVDTAWQLTRSLVAFHPGRSNWEQTIGRAQPPELVSVTPLPVGPDTQWYQRPNNTLERRFEGSPHKDVLTSARQQTIDYSKGMMGSPAVGSLLFKLKEFDTNEARLNHDRNYGRLLDSKGRITVTGSGVGGTGASIAPTLAQRLARGLAEGNPGSVMAVLLLEWFKFDEEGGEPELLARAQRRNRRMHENASSALEFYGQSLARTVATVPLGMPRASRLTRTFTGDIGQPVRESFLHAVGALAAYRQFLSERPYLPGLYMMGAVRGAGRLDGGTAIPGGTLQSLANQAATVADLLGVWRSILVREHRGRVTPAVYEAVAKVSGEPAQVADHLQAEAEHFSQQIVWLEKVLGVVPKAHEKLSLEQQSRARLLEERVPLPVQPGAAPEDIALALFHWTASWVRSQARSDNRLVVSEGPVEGGHWPDLQNEEGLGVSATANGDLSRIDDANRDAVLEGFVDESAVSVNGWPHPLAGASFFEQAIRKHEPVARRQLELLLVGIVSGRLELRRLDSGLFDSHGLTLDRVIAEERLAGSPGVAELAVVDPERGGLAVGFSAPRTLLAPVPSLGPEEADEIWTPLWRKLSGSTDGAHWAEAKEPASWGEDHDRVIAQILSWIDHLKKIHPGQAPPWTRVFGSHRGRHEDMPFGTGTQLQMLWAGPGGLEPREVQIPTTEVEEWTPPPGTPRLDETELFARVPSLHEVEDERGNRYAMVEFEVPDERDRVRGWWSEHLDTLKRQGEFHIWSRDDRGAVVIGMVDGGGLKATTLAHSRLLDRRTVAVQTTEPFRQDPVPGSKRSRGSLLWPDLPIHSDYVALVQTFDGRDVADLLFEGERLDVTQWAPERRQDASDRLVATWSLRMRGRSTPFVVELRVEAPETPEKHHWAHWMIWPRFRTRRPNLWRTYYAYQRSSHPRLRADVLWIDPDRDGGRLARTRAPEEDIPTYPVSYRVTGNHPAHTGGPPLGFVQRDPKGGEQGVYLLALELLPESDLGAEMAVDFGTSHSVAAVRVEGEKESAAVRLEPELREGSLTLSTHVSESWAHVTASSKEAGLLAEGAWLPSYTPSGVRQGREELLPSDLIFRVAVEPKEKESIDAWVAGRDYRIPPLGIGRPDLAEVLVTDFKWEAGVKGFRGRETMLQEHYLSMFLELVLAEVLVAHCQCYPTRGAALTFTYPLRYRPDQVQRYEQTLERVLMRVRAGTGLRLQLHDEIGTYDESRAARLSGRKFGEVMLVADLGGGTLDLLISAETGPTTRFAQVTDSVQLGGNYLLRQMAQDPSGLLPADGNWICDGSHDTETKLRAWMRIHGCPALFGLDGSGERPVLDSLSVRGFARPAEAHRARQVIDRYFRLVVEYLARNLTAYLVHHWYPQVRSEDHDRLAISVQLRGNGWRLRYQDEDYGEATEAIQAQVRSRVLALWSEIAPEEYPAPEKERWASAVSYLVRDPKTAPIRSVVGLSQPHDEARRDAHTHTPVALELHRDNGSREPIEWGEPIPFDTKGSGHVEVHDLEPAVPLTDPLADRQVVLRKLDASRAGQINGGLRQGAIDPSDLTFRAPVGPLVWETLFDTRCYWPEQS